LTLEAINTTVFFGKLFAAIDSIFKHRATRFLKNVNPKVDPMIYTHKNPGKAYEKKQSSCPKIHSFFNKEL